LSAATNIDSQDPPGQGDYTICIECGQVLRFVPGVAAELAAAGREWRPALAVVAVGDEELRALMYADPTLMARLTVVRWAVDQMRVGRRAQRN
jgi:hypothetical protein